MGPNYNFAQKVPTIIWQKGVLVVTEGHVMMLLLGQTQKIGILFWAPKAPKNGKKALLGPIIKKKDSMTVMASK